jgi:hypothetical protein
MSPVQNRYANTLQSPQPLSSEQHVAAQTKISHLVVAGYPTAARLELRSKTQVSSHTQMLASFANTANPAIRYARRTLRIPT